MKQTKITDYFHTEKINNKLEKLRNECLRIREEGSNAIWYLC